jgi:hypothetical protein
MRHLRWTLALAAALHSGCGTLAPQVPAAPEPAALGKVAVVAGTEAPEIRFEGFARGKGEGAAAGAGGTFLACAAAMGPGGCSGPFCGAVVVLWLGVCGVAGVVGGVAGGAAAPGGATVRSAETTLRRLLDAHTLQESLRKGIEDAARARGAPLAAPAGADTLLEATLVRVGTQGAGINAPVEVRIEVRVRLLRAAGGAELYRAQYLHFGERRKLAEWAADGGAPLARALGAGYEALSAQIADGVFLLYPFPDQQAGTSGMLSSAFGLAPLEPRTRGTLTGDRLIGDRFEWTRVDSLQPALRWQAFPRPADLAAAPAEMARVADVSYELMIAPEHNLAPAGVVYLRAGLRRPEHRVESPLRPGTRYFWTMRARFTLDGVKRVTGWGATHYMARDGMTAPSRFSYRFRTP